MLNVSIFISYHSDIAKISAVAITLSGDGTTRKHINYESKCVTIVKKNKNGESIPTTLFTGISSASNTSETQFDGWVSMILDTFKIYKSSPMDKKAIATLLEFLLQQSKELI